MPKVLPKQVRLGAVVLGHHFGLLLRFALYGSERKLG